MAEYIERDATIQLLKHIGAPTYAVNAVSLVEPIHFFSDVAPVVHGRWNNWCGEPLWQECSVCNYRIQYSYSKDCNYCPNCGADMRGE